MGFAWTDEKVAIVVAAIAVKIIPSLIPVDMGSTLHFSLSLPTLLKKNFMIANSLPKLCKTLLVRLFEAF
jgi:hypothetical protein